MTATINASTSSGVVITPDNSGTVALQGAGTTGLTVDSSGYVLTPARPAFFAYKTASSTISANSIIPFGSVELNVGGHYSTSTNRFTAPINGIYSITARVQYAVGGTNYYAGCQVYKNGALYAQAYGSQYTPDAHINLCIPLVMSLNAGDYLTVLTASFSGTVPACQGDADKRTSFSGFLIG